MKTNSEVARDLVKKHAGPFYPLVISKVLDLVPEPHKPYNRALMEHTIRKHKKDIPVDSERLIQDLP